MKFIRLILVFMFFTLETMIGQRADPAMPRFYYQQKFIMDKFLLRNNNLVFSDTKEVDSIFTALQKSWKSFVKDSLANNKSSIPVQALDNLDAYSYFLTLRSIAYKNELNNDIEFHLFKDYMLPSLIYDYHFIKSNPSLDNLKLIWAGSLSNTFIFGVKYSANTQTFRSSYELFKNLSVLLHSFENSDNETKAYAVRLLNFLNENEYEIETRNYLFNNQQDLAFNYFISGISTNKYPKYRVKSMGETLFKFYLSRGESDKCLSILNNLFFNTSNDELPRDTLLKWYKIADPANGSKYYSKISNESTLNYFKIDQKLSIQLPKNWNYIFNSITEEKLKKAKYILIDFWYSACSPCIAEIPKLNELHSLLKDNENIIFISINSDFSTTRKDSSYVTSTARTNNIKFPVVFDNTQSNFTKQFNVSGFPSKFIINNQGQPIVKKDDSIITLASFYDFIKIQK